MAYDDPKIVGITGGIGTGQTTVAKMFEKFGAKVIHADDIARRVVEEDREVKAEIRQAFGNEVFTRNGHVNRKKLAQIVFEDEAKTHRLNQIVHPRMVSRIVDELEEARDSGKYPMIAIDAALIYEANLEQMFDAVVVVTARLKDRIQRIRERDGLSEKEIRDRISRQIPVEEKVKWADYVLRNTADLKELEKHARRVYQLILRGATARRRTGTRRKTTRSSRS
ncbi:MAG: dephospho-CoA kinase [Calditrichaeota bacterium]|nr:MAG: dephospho-CoA kinase [Calditrichota bacterium]